MLYISQSLTRDTSLSETRTSFAWVSDLEAALNNCHLESPSL